MSASRISFATIAILGFGIASGFVGVKPASAQYNAATDFDAAHDPSTKDGGVWSYGYETTLGSGFGLDTQSGVVSGLNFWTSAAGYPGSGSPAIEYNGTNSAITSGGQTWAPGALSIHDGNSNPNYGIVRFTAPTTGLYTLSGSFAAGDVNGTTSSYILSNGTIIYSATRSGVTSDFFSQSVDLTAGSTIDFVVGGAHNSGDTQLNASISAAASAPEPGALSLLLPLALPIGGMFARRRRTNMRRH